MFGKPTFLLSASVLALLLASGCTQDAHSGDFARIVRLDVSLGSATPAAASNISPSATGLSVLQISLGAGSDEQVRVQTLTFTETGTTDAQNDITGIGLYVDANNDGLFSPAVDTEILGSVAGGYGASDTVTFTTIDRIIHPGAAETWILVYDLAGTGTAGETFIPSVQAAGDVAAEGGESGRTALVTGPPVTGNTLALDNVGSLTISLGSSNPPAAGVSIPTANVSMLQVHIVAGITENVDISSVTFTADGSGDPNADISSVALYNDLDGSGTLTGGDVPIGAPTTFSSGTATFGGLSEIITAGAGNAEDWIVVCDFTGGSPGDTYRVSLLSNTDVSATGVLSTLVILPLGPPVYGNFMTVPASPPSLTVTNLTAGGLVAISPIESDVVMFHLRFAAGASEGITLQSLTFHATGVGHDAHDISSVCLFEDMNTDGVLQRGSDTLVTSLSYGLTYSGDEGTVTFAGLSHTIPAGTSDELLLIYYMGGSGAAADGYSVTLDTAVDITAVGAGSASPAVITGGAFTGSSARISTNPAWTSALSPVPGGYIGEHGHSAIYDTANRRFILFGGVAGLNASNNDTWEVDLTTAPPTWTQLSFGPMPLPGNRHGHSAVYIPAGASGPGSAPKMWVFGGYSFGTGFMQDVWELDLTSGSESWTQLAPGGSTLPSPRGYHAAVWDTAQSRMIVYGGSNTLPLIWGFPGGPLTLFNDVWELDLATTTWTSLSPGGTAPPVAGSGRAGQTAVYDATVGRMIVFAGCDYTWPPNATYYNDTYELDLTSGSETWSALQNSGTVPSARYLHTAVMDEIGRRMFVFAGGTDNFMALPTLHNDIHVYNLSLSTTAAVNQWSLASPGGGPPVARYNHASAYDPIGSRSCHVTGQNTTDAWECK
jgi:hypothetical protein